MGVMDWWAGLPTTTRDYILSDTSVGGNGIISALPLGNVTIETNYAFRNFDPDFPDTLKHADGDGNIPVVYGRKYGTDWTNQFAVGSNDIMNIHTENCIGGCGGYYIFRRARTNAGGTNYSTVVNGDEMGGFVWTGRVSGAGNPWQSGWLNSGSIDIIADSVASNYIGTRMSFNTVGTWLSGNQYMTVRFNSYGTGAKEVVDLVGKTQSGKVAVFATDGTVMESVTKFQSGTGSPESVVTAPVGSIYTRTDGGAGTTLYVKETGTGNTGWVAK